MGSHASPAIELDGRHRGFEPLEFRAFLRHELESGYLHHQPDSSR